MTTRFEQVIHGEDDAGLHTILVRESVADDVAAYIVQGEHCDATRALAAGSKLTEAAARKYGAGWPTRLSYRR